MDIPGIEQFLVGLPFAAAANDSIAVLAPPAPQLTEAAFVRSVILFTMGLGSTIGNTYTIWNIRKSRVAKKLSRNNCTAIYLLITHLSLADLLVTFFCMIGDGIWGLTVQWLAGDFM